MTGTVHISKPYRQQTGELKRTITYRDGQDRLLVIVAKGDTELVDAYRDGSVARAYEAGFKVAGDV